MKSEKIKHSKLKNANVLLLGGTGFLGRHILKRLIKYGARVTIVSLFREGEYRGELLSLCNLLRGDIFDKNITEYISKFRWDYVINCGGYIKQGLEENIEKEMFRVHFESVRLLVSILNKDIKRFIQTGSAVEYGNNKAPHNENMREMPLNPYAAAKVASTHYLKMRYYTYGLPVVILRPFFIYGKGQDKSKLIPYIIDRAINNEDVLLSSGKQIRDPIYVEDVADAYINSCLIDEAVGEIINLGSGNPMTVYEISETIVKIVGKGKIKIGVLKDRDGDIQISYSDTSNMQKILGLNITSYIDGIRRTIFDNNEI